MRVRTGLLLGALLSACSASDGVEGSADAGGVRDVTMAESGADSAQDALPDRPMDAPSEPADAAPDSAPEAPPEDARDAPVGDLSGRCAVDGDCVGTPGRPVCDAAEGRCVRCTPARDTCPVAEHCDPESRACAPGCRSDEGCATGAARLRCDTARHVCVACLSSADCPVGMRCTAGACAPGCEPDRGCGAAQTCCDSACVDTQRDTSHCGACGRRCEAAPHASPVCAAGACAARCDEGFGDCDRSAGCETDLRGAVAHCGACGRPCATRPGAAARCVDGACAYGCAEGRGDCDGMSANGCEAVLGDDPDHCGRCGVRCASGVCAAGACQPPRCDDRRQNGTETDVDCGGDGVCARCELGRRCVADADCASRECRLGLCLDSDGSTCRGAVLLGPRSPFASSRVHATASAFRGVGSLVGDGAGTLWAQDPYGNGPSGDRVLRIGPDGAVTTLAAPPGLSTCTVQQLARSAAGDLLLWNVGANVLLRITAAGAVGTLSDVGGIGGGGSCTDSGVQGLLGRTDGTLAATSPARSALLFLDATGNETRRITGLGTSFRLAEDPPSGGLLASAGSLILRYTPDGTRSTVRDVAPLGVHPLRRDGAGDIVFGSGLMVLAVRGDGSDPRLVLACTPGQVSDLVFDRPTGAASGTSLYVSTLGATIDADDGDTILELRRAP